MNLSLLSGTKSRELNQEMRTYLSSEFHVGPESIAKLRGLEKNGQFAGRKVRYVRIFDASLVSNGDGSKLKYQDFQAINHRGHLRFEGYTDSNGTVYLTDQRPKVADGLVQDSD